MSVPGAIVLMAKANYILVSVLSGEFVTCMAALLIVPPSWASVVFALGAGMSIGGWLWIVFPDETERAIAKVKQLLKGEK